MPSLLYFHGPLSQRASFDVSSLTGSVLDTISKLILFQTGYVLCGVCVCINKRQMPSTSKAAFGARGHQLAFALRQLGRWSRRVGIRISRCVKSRGCWNFGSESSRLQRSGAAPLVAEPEENASTQIRDARATSAVFGSFAGSPRNPFAPKYVAVFVRTFTERVRPPFECECDIRSASAHGSATS